MSLAILGVSFGAPWIAVVALKPIAAETGGARSVPAFASALAWFGSGIGGIAMGWLADRYGVRWTVMFGGDDRIGLAISAYGQGLGQTGALYIGHGLFIGLIGNAGLNAPLYVYVSRWFDRRRGSALALISSGQYIAGAVWPPIFDRLIAGYGWRADHAVVRPVQVAIIVPIALVFLKPPPEVICPGRRDRRRREPTVLGWPPNLVFAMLLVAAFAAACRCRCRRPISSRCAPTSASSRRMAPRCSRCCSPPRSSAARCGAGFRTASAG